MSCVAIADKHWSGKEKIFARRQNFH